MLTMGRRVEQKIRWDRRAYLRLRRLRDRGARWVVAPLARLGVPPWAVSVAGVIFAASMLWTLGSRPGWALAAFLAALSCDAFDGALARRLERCGSRGKLIDHLCDTATLGLLVIALAHAGLAPTGRALAALALTVASLAAAILYRRRRQGGGSGGGLEGGFFVHLPKALLYAALVTFLLGGPDRLALSLWVFNLLAGIVAAGYLLALRSRQPAGAPPSAPLETSG